MTQKHLVLAGLIALALLSASCARIQSREQRAIPSTGDRVQTIVSSGQNRQYSLHVPPGYQSDQAMPLVVNLHGANSNAEQEERLSGMSAQADTAGFIVAYPEGTGNPQTWHFGPGAQGDADLQFMRDLVNQIKNSYAIDAARVYATGISNGAQMTNKLGCEMSDAIAAIAPVSGGYFRGEQCKPTRPVPVVAFHGTDDKLLPYGGEGNFLLPVPEWAANWAQRDGCALSPKVTFHKGQVTGETWSNCRESAEVTLYTIQGGGHSWPGSSVMPKSITTQDVNATDTMWQFFAAHPLK